MKIVSPQLNRNWIVWFPSVSEDIHETLSQSIIETTLPTISSAQNFGFAVDPLRMVFALDEDGEVLKALTHLLNRDTAYSIDLLSSADVALPSTRFWVNGYANTIEFDSLSCSDNDGLLAHVTFSYDQLAVNGIPMSC